MIEVAVQPGPVQGLTFVGSILLMAVALYAGYAVLERAMTLIVESVTDT